MSTEGTEPLALMFLSTNPGDQPGSKTYQRLLIFNYQSLSSSIPPSCAGLIAETIATSSKWNVLQAQS